MPRTAPVPPDLQDRLRFALTLADAAAEVTLRYYRSRSLKIETKPDQSPVTAADRDAEAAMRKMIARHWPDDGVLGEEHGDERPNARGRWMLDPIDGTVSFTRGVPLFGTLIAYEYDGTSVLGVISMPALSESVFAALGTGAWHVVSGSQPQPARVSSTQSLSDALVCTTGLELFRSPEASRAFDSLLASGGKIRGWSDCYAHLLVATGRADAVIEPKIAPWDVAPMIPIMEEAGGMYTDWSGESTHLSPTGLSANSALHEALLALLATRD